MVNLAIRLQDRNLLVSYIQTYLRDYFNMTLVRSKSKNSYEISQSYPIRVTGQYTRQTYLSISLFMLYNYPNEKFPERWDLRNPTDPNSWIITPFDSSKLVLTMDMLIQHSVGEMSEFSKEDYEQILKSLDDPQQYFSWDTLIKYFYNEDDMLEVLSDKTVSDEFSQSDVNHSLIVFLVNNLDQLDDNPEIADLNDRIPSYFLEEVVTSESPPDEILRVQKIIYPEGVEYNRAGIFDDQMLQDVTTAQENFLRTYTTTSKDGTQQVVLPEGYDGFKVTGYVDPWTEFILKGGID